MGPYLILSILLEKFARGAYSLCFYTLLQLRYLSVSLMPIGDHEIKIVNFADSTTIFLKDITCLDRIQVILKLYEDASSSKINFSKSDASGPAQFTLKYLELALVTLFSTTPNGKTYVTVY